MAQKYGQITEEALDDLRDRIGKEMSLPEPYMTAATIDNFRRWAYGIGIDDLLYTDPDYAADGPYGDLVAPPTFLNPTVNLRGGGLPGVHAMYAGDEWTWHKPIHRGYKIDTETKLTDVIERDSSFAGRSVQQIYTVEHYNQYREHLATRKWWVFRTERGSAAEKGKYDSVDLASWDEDDIERFREHYRNEERRGAETRYFEDVLEGDELDTLLKGPLSVTQEVTFLRGWGGPYTSAHKRLFEMQEKMPNLAIPNKYGVPEPPERVHWDDEFAREVGVPAAYDYGPERVGWLAHVASHWMGDDGFLEHLRVELRKHNLMGDVTWCDGRVTDTYVDGDRHLVDVDLEARDQRDELSAKGSATIRLPSRE